MYVCMYVCMYLCMYMCMYICMYVMYVCMHVCTYVCVCTCVCVSMYVCTYVCVCTCVCVSMCVCMYPMPLHAYTCAKPTRICAEKVIILLRTSGANIQRHNTRHYVIPYPTDPRKSSFGFGG
jgi:hypothetical protein